MKINKSDIILIAIAVLLIIIGLFAFNNKKEEGSDKEYLNEITYAEYEDLIASGDKFIVIIERDGCSYCEKYMPIVKKVANAKEADVKFINLSNITEEEYNKLATSNSYLENEEWGTPTTLLMTGTEVLDSISGYVEKTEFEEFIEKNME